MNTTSIPLSKLEAQRPSRRAREKSRAVDANALAEVRLAVAELPLRRDLLIEHLHRVHDRFGQLSSAHIAALASLHKLAQVEVFEVASFYHHFDIVRENADGSFPVPASLTIRVCNGLSCELAGAQDLLKRLPALLNTDVRILEAPCVGRCEQAPVAVVHQHPVLRATASQVAAAAAAGRTHDETPDAIDLDAYLAAGGYATLRRCISGDLPVEKRAEDHGRQRSARPGRRGFSVRAQMAHRARRGRASADGGEHRRRRTRHLQGTATTWNATRTASWKACSSPPGGGHLGRVHLPAR